MKKYNILHAIDVSGTGGAETVFINLIKNLDNNLFNHIVIIPEKGWISEQLKDSDIQLIIMNMKGSINIRYLFNIVKTIKNLHIDLIQSHLLGSNVYSCLAGIITNTPVVSTFHGEIDISSNERFLPLKRTIINKGSNKIVFVSNYLKKVLNNNVAFDTSKSITIYNGIKTSSKNKSVSTNLRDSLKLSDTDYIVGLVGNVIHAKAYDLLIKSAAICKTSNNKIKFVIAGDTSDPLYNNFLRQINDLNLTKHVHFIGFHNNIEEFMNEIDIYVICSYSEGFSISTIEAMNAFKAVISTRCGGPEEIITDNVTGILINNNSPEELSKAISLLFNNPDLTKRLGNAAHIKVESNFSIDKMIDEYTNVYLSSLSC